MTKIGFGWACVTPHGEIDASTVRACRADAQAELGLVFMQRATGESLANGWRRAYRMGWRCIRVVIEPER